MTLEAQGGHGNETVRTPRTLLAPLLAPLLAHGH